MSQSACGGMPQRACARPSLRPRPCAMKVSTNVLSDAFSFGTHGQLGVDRLAYRATNFPQALPPLFGAGTGSFLAFSAAIVAFNASLPFVIASLTVSPSEIQSDEHFRTRAGRAATLRACRATAARLRPCAPSRAPCRRAARRRRSRTRHRAAPGGPPARSRPASWSARTPR